MSAPCARGCVGTRNPHYHVGEEPFTEHRDSGAAFHPERMQTGTPSASMTFRAVLTATTNPYLAPRLPLAGYVQITEFDIHGGVQPSGALFMPDGEDGKATSFVHVADARFEFGTRPAVYRAIEDES